MSGNVWEWCWDLYSCTHPWRRFRGGNCYGGASSAAVSTRAYNDSPAERYRDIGFRLAFSSGQ
jgi:formylglycine-generating enzyme required for sulfatase activity